MRTFALAQKGTQQTTSAKATTPSRAHFGQSREVNSIFHLQRTIGNQAVRRLLEENTRNVKGDSTTEIARFAHDFIQIPLHSPAARAIQAKRAISEPGDEYYQVADVQEEMWADHTSPSVAPGVHFDFARILVTAPSIQRKPTTSSPGDPFEREADDVADRVMRMVEPTPISSTPAEIQRKCAGCEEEEKAVPTQHAPSAAIQGIEGGEEEAGLMEDSAEAIQRKAESGFAAVAGSPIVGDRLTRTQSAGELLASAARHPMEVAFGRDFSCVRVHRDSEGAELSRQLSALAFTHGSHIYFGSGAYDPEGSSGKRLLAHELAHVVQQGHAAPGGGHKAAPIATAVQAAAPVIQRAATWGVPAVHPTNNLANTALVGVDAGVTLPTINGTIGGGALNAPTVTVTPVAAGGFDATVTAVPANVISADETVLSPGPWRRVATRAAIGARFPSLTQCTGAGNSNFRARGNPSDAAMAAANRRHEDHHAADARAAFNASIVPWDARLTTANTAGTTFHGATDAAARAALFTAMGGTMAQVRGAFVAAWNAAIPVYHGTAAGGPIGAPTDPTAAADCSWSFARYTNPS